MNHTEIRIPDGSLETILNVGTTNDDDVYIDIRVYRYGEVIDVGDITITRDDWNAINKKLNPQKLYQCPVCGDVVTEDDIVKDLTSGGYGMCMCQYCNGHRTLTHYETFTPEELNPPITTGELELIRIMREMMN